MHYSRWKRHGDPLKTLPRQTPEEVLSSRVERQGDCLIWTGYKDKDGYGRLRVGSKILGAHRYAWELENGPIPEGRQIDHTCWEKSCVNVDHLRAITHSENQRYRSGATEHNKASGVRNVYRVRRGKGWQVEIRKDGKSYYFGSFPTVKEAEQVASQARKELFGEFAGKG